MISYRKAALYLLVGCLVVAPAARADQGIVNSVSYLPLPTPTTIQVRPFDDSSENIVLKTEIEASLRAAGFGVAEKSDLILNFETSDEIGAWSSTDRRSIIELESKGGRDGGENARAQVNIFNSTSGALLNKGRRAGTSITTPSSYRIDVNIEQTTTRKQLWQGWAIGNLGGAVDGRELVRQMVPAVVGTVGKTVRQQRFELR